MLVQGCGTTTRMSAVPHELTSRAGIPGMPGVRYSTGGDDVAELSKVVLDALGREQELLAKQGRKGGALPHTHFLAISGGGDNGAYTAGLLKKIWPYVEGFRV
jgi:hypothetical protein